MHQSFSVFVGESMNLEFFCDWNLLRLVSFFFCQIWTYKWLFFKSLSVSTNAIFPSFYALEHTHSLKNIIILNVITLRHSFLLLQYPKSTLNLPGLLTYVLLNLGLQYLQEKEINLMTFLEEIEAWILCSIHNSLLVFYFQGVSPESA